MGKIVGALVVAAVLGAALWLLTRADDRPAPAASTPPAAAIAGGAASSVPPAPATTAGAAPTAPSTAEAAASAPPDIPDIPAAAFQAEVRRYAGALSRSAPLPAHILAEDLFSADTLRQLGVPAGSRITRLADRPVTDRAAFEAALLPVPPGGWTPMALDAEAPDGRPLRVYLHLRP